MLDPSLPAVGVSKMERYAAKFGAERMAAMIPYMQRIGSAEKPPIKFSYGGRISNTLDSHRLLEFALQRGGPELQTALVEQLFHAYFEMEADVGDRRALTDAAVAVGMDRQEVSTFLDSDVLVDDVKRDVTAWASRYRISGVPHFVIDGRLSLSGAQEADTFEEALTEAAERKRR